MSTRSLNIAAAVQPDLPEALSQAVSDGRFVADMRNYWVRTTGAYYFPGLYTAVLPMIPGIWAIRRVVKESNRQRSAQSRLPSRTPGRAGMAGGVAP